MSKLFLSEKISILIAVIWDIIKEMFPFVVSFIFVYVIMELFGSTILWILIVIFFIIIVVFGYGQEVGKHKRYYH